MEIFCVYCLNSHSVIIREDGQYFCSSCDETFVPELDDESDDERLAQEYNDDMDGDHASALASAGFGTDEDYGYFGGDDC
jgi:uncharacterized Zn finger protein (UPF0148 family)